MNSVIFILPQIANMTYTYTKCKKLVRNNITCKHVIDCLDVKLNNKSCHCYNLYYSNDIIYYSN